MKNKQLCHLRRNVVFSETQCFFFNGLVPCYNGDDVRKNIVNVLKIRHERLNGNKLADMKHVAVGLKEFLRSMYDAKVNINDKWVRKITMSVFV